MIKKFLAQKQLYSFANTVKAPTNTFKLTGSTFPGQDKQFNVNIPSCNQNIEVYSPLETFLAGLTACEVYTTKVHAKKMGIKIGEIKVTKSEAVLNMAGFFLMVPPE